jgi:hypothetical protein
MNTNAPPEPTGGALFQLNPSSPTATPPSSTDATDNSTLGLESGFGRKVRGLKTTVDELPAYIERVVRNFVGDREPGEHFATWALHADEELLV